MTKKYRIGIDARLYRRSTGGIGRYTHALLDELTKIDKENKFFVFLTKEDKQEYYLKAKNFKPILSPFPHYSLKEQFGFLTQLNSYNLDLMHFTNFNHPIFYNRDYVITIHDMTMTLFPAPGKQSSAIPRFLYHLVLANGTKKAKRIIVDSQNTRKDLINIAQTPPNKISVIHLGVDSNYIRESSPENKKILKEKYGIVPPYILFVSQWRPHKGIEKLVKSFEILHQRFKTKELSLVITGKPNPQFPKIEERINASPLRRKIITPGFVDEKDMVALYSHARAFIFPSLYEGFGLNPLEAMACGIPVATSNLSCIPEVCGRAALYFDPKDPEDIAVKTYSLLTNQKLRRDLIDRGYKNLERFSWQKMAKQTYEIYQEILKKPFNNG